jgi:hypothetical protein
VSLVALNFDFPHPAEPDGLHPGRQSYEVENLGAQLIYKIFFVGNCEELTGS